MLYTSKNVVKFLTGTLGDRKKAVKINNRFRDWDKSEADLNNNNPYFGRPELISRVVGELLTGLVNGVYSNIDVNAFKDVWAYLPLSELTKLNVPISTMTHTTDLEVLKAVLQGRFDLPVRFCPDHSFCVEPELICQLDDEHLWLFTNMHISVRTLVSLDMLDTRVLESIRKSDPYKQAVAGVSEHKNAVCHYEVFDGLCTHYNKQGLK